jgi:hypothetical protein
MPLCPVSCARWVRVTLLLLAAVLSAPMATAQRTPQPIFTELFAYDPATPSQLLGKWLISPQFDSRLRPLRVRVLEDRIGKTVGRVTVQEGDGGNYPVDKAQAAMVNESSERDAIEITPGMIQAGAVALCESGFLDSHWRYPHQVQEVVRAILEASLGEPLQSRQKTD